MKKIIVLSLALTAALPLSAMAQSGVYLRGHVGEARIDEKPLGIKDNDTMFGAAVGYRFNDHFGIEAGYVDLGEQESSRRNGVGGRSLSVEAKGATVGVTGKYRFGQDDSGWYIDGRVGAIRSQFEGVRRGGSPAAPIAVRFDDKSRFNPYYAVGVGYDFTKHFGLGLNYTRYEVGDRNQADVDAATVSFEYRF